MTTVKLHFRRLDQHEQDVGTADEFMRASVTMDITAGDQKRWVDLVVPVKSAAGGTFAGDYLEVGIPVGYDGPMQYQHFREAVEEYYREQVGPRGKAISIGGSVESVHMGGNTFHTDVVKAFEVESDEQGDTVPGKFVHRQLRLIDVMDQSGLIRDATFENCVLVGPAVISLAGGCQFVENWFDAPDDLLFWEAPKGRVGGSGCLVVIDSSFRKCRFYGIGIGGDAALIALFRADLKAPG